MDQNKENFINLISNEIFFQDLFKNTIENFLIKNNIQYIRIGKNEYFMLFEKHVYLRGLFNYRMFRYGKGPNMFDLLDLSKGWVESSKDLNYFPLYQLLQIFENE